MLLEMWREQAKLYGIDPMKIRIEKQRELGKELSVDEEKQIIQQEIMKKTQNNREHRLVGENELLTYLNQGWELIQPVNGKFLVRK